MEIVHRSAQVPYSAQAIYTLVNDIEAYPQFLPWCVDAIVHERDEQHILASLTLEKGGFRKRFTTQNQLESNRRLEMHLVEGPFKHLYGVWTFEPEGDEACLVTVALEFDFSSRIIAMLIGPLFQHAANTLLDAFVERAHQVCGKQHES
jgi:ribosome-associated toxin RatA of RatAB toxin-antitoxin module